jgi:uncharacterized protein (DUF736 family)
MNGQFRTAGSSYNGVIRTLTITTEAIFEPPRKKTDKSPDYRITNGHSEIGVAWKETSEASGKSYVSVRLKGEKREITIRLTRGRSHSCPGCAPSSRGGGSRLRGRTAGVRHCG